jgi:TM2 domain-containing membrane protein YozV
MSLPRQSMSSVSEIEISNKKMAAGLTGIFLGAFGVHKFILGYTKSAVIVLGASLLTCGVGYLIFQVIGIVEGVKYLTKSNVEFQAEYLDAKKEWF